jgi:hypothetical protein
LSKGIAEVDKLKAYVNSVRKSLMPGVCGLALGGVLVFGLSYQFMPISTTHYENVMVDVNGDGQLDFVVSAEVVLNSSPLP